MYQLEWTQFSKQDYENLDGSQKVFVNKALDRIKINGMRAGKPLHSNLSKCNKIKNRKMGLRIVFREREGSIQIIQVVAIGKRDRGTVYKTAEDRLK